MRLIDESDEANRIKRRMGKIGDSGDRGFPSIKPRYIRVARVRLWKKCAVGKSKKGLAKATPSLAHTLYLIRALPIFIPPIGSPRPYGSSQSHLSARVRDILLRQSLLPGISCGIYSGKKWALTPLLYIVFYTCPGHFVLNDLARCIAAFATLTFFFPSFIFFQGANFFPQLLFI